MAAPGRRVRGPSGAGRIPGRRTRGRRPPGLPRGARLQPPRLLIRAGPGEAAQGAADAVGGEGQAAGVPQPEVAAHLRQPLRVLFQEQRRRLPLQPPFHARPRRAWEKGGKPTIGREGCHAFCPGGCGPGPGGPSRPASRLNCRTGSPRGTAGRRPRPEKPHRRSRRIAAAQESPRHGRDGRRFSASMLQNNAPCSMASSSALCVCGSGSNQRRGMLRFTDWRYSVFSSAMA